MGGDEDDPLPYDDGYGHPADRLVDHIVRAGTGVLDAAEKSQARAEEAMTRKSEQHIAKSFGYLGAQTEGRLTALEGRLTDDPQLAERGQQILAGADTVREEIESLERDQKAPAHNVRDIYKTVPAMKDLSPRALHFMVRYKGERER